jgi:hypothetical protein
MILKVLPLRNLTCSETATYTRGGQNNPMICANPATPKWVKIVFRTMGTVNAVAVLLGTSFLADSVYLVLTGHTREPHDAPYFRFAFAVMALIDLSFASVLLITAIRFMQTKLSAVNLYSITVLLLAAYDVAIAMLWRSCREEIAASVASATLGGTEATMVFEFLFLIPFLYPLVSVVLAQLLKRRYGIGKTPISA